MRLDGNWVPIWGARDDATGISFYIFPSNARRAKGICSKLISMKFL